MGMKNEKNQRENRGAWLLVFLCIVRDRTRRCTVYSIRYDDALLYALRSFFFFFVSTAIWENIQGANGRTDVFGRSKDKSKQAKVSKRESVYVCEKACGSCNSHDLFSPAE